VVCFSADPNICMEEIRIPSMDTPDFQLGCSQKQVGSNYCKVVQIYCRQWQTALSLLEGTNLKLDI
jgi:hypothetical protein